MKRIAALLSQAAAGLSFATVALAAAPGDQIENFRLLDQHGRSHELHYLSDATAVVLVTHGNGCPIVRQAMPALQALHEQYGPQGVEFLLLNSNLQDGREAIATEAAEFGIHLPILSDDTQLIGEALGVERTGEVFVVDPKTWKLSYRGAIDDRLDYEKQKPAATKRYLADALDAMLSGNPPPLARTRPVGCLVNFPERGRPSHAAISYAETIAPLLQDKCVTCHQTGGVAPWAMTSYAMVRGFAPMIREVLRTKRMPPWHADPHYGSFTGDRSLSAEEVRTLVHWIEAGAPRGSGPDPLAAQRAHASEWTLGTPDLVVEVPAFDVLATGVVEYQYPSLPNPTGRDVWVRAVEILPGERAVVHHVLAGLRDPSSSQTERVAQIAAFGGYAPGKNAFFYPPDTGVFLSKDARLLFQMHYTPNGKPARDVTRVGYYFAQTPPQHALHLTFLMKGSLAIPPRAKAHTESVEHVYERPVMVYTLMPHAHLRGKAARFTAVYPDGRQEVLLNVPKYDFSWQTTYVLAQPKALPAGTKVVFDMTWDNSAENPANPDPDATVYWGDQTWEEMNAGWIRFRYLDETDATASAR
jgi:peroxiredoxin